MHAQEQLLRSLANIHTHRHTHPHPHTHLSRLSMGFTLRNTLISTTENKWGSKRKLIFDTLADGFYGNTIYVYNICFYI